MLTDHTYFFQSWNLKHTYIFFFGLNGAYAHMPYLTLWEKISQNLTHLKANSHKIFQPSQNFQNILQHILWRNKHKSHFVVFITSFLHLNKAFWLNLTESYQNSLKNLPYLTDFSPQLMACMHMSSFFQGTQLIQGKLLIMNRNSREAINSRKSFNHE